MKNIFLAMILIVLCIYIADAQEVVSTVGDSYFTGGYEVSWTLGEPIIEIVSNGNNILTQGFHQSKLVITSVLYAKDNNEISVYPNPTNEFLNIQIKGIQFFDITAEIYSMEGKLLKQNNLTNENSILKMHEFADGSYLLKISSGSKRLRTFKVIKQY